MPAYNNGKKKKTSGKKKKTVSEMAAERKMLRKKKADMVEKELARLGGGPTKAQRMAKQREKKKMQMEATRAAVRKHGESVMKKYMKRKKKNK